MTINDALEATGLIDRSPHRMVWCDAPSGPDAPLMLLCRGECAAPRWSAAGLAIEAGEPVAFADLVDSVLASLEGVEALLRVRWCDDPPPERVAALRAAQEALSRFVGELDRAAGGVGW